MYILRANPRGGRPIKPNHFPLHQDKDGNFGYLIGYREDGDKVLLPIAMAEQLANAFASNISAFKNMTQKLKPKLPIKERLFIWLFGRKQLNDLKEMYREEIGD